MPPALQNQLHIPLFGILAWLWYHTLDTRNIQHRPALEINSYSIFFIGLYLYLAMASNLTFPTIAWHIDSVWHS